MPHSTVCTDLQTAYQVQDENAASPLIHVQLARPPRAIWEGKALLQKIVEDAFNHDSVLFTVHRLSDLDRAYVHTPASIAVAVTAKHREEDMQKAVRALRKASQHHLQT